MISDPQVPVRLTALQAGASARLHGTQLDDDTRSLLRSLGLTDASRLRVCKAGEPCIIQVRTTRIGLSSVVAGNILVVHESEPSSADRARPHDTDGRHRVDR